MEPMPLNSDEVPISRGFYSNHLEREVIQCYSQVVEALHLLIHYGTKQRLMYFLQWSKL